jgi:hypothetical protein
LLKVFALPVMSLAAAGGRSRALRLLHFDAARGDYSGETISINSNLITL